MIHIRDLKELEQYKDCLIKNENGLILNAVYHPYIPLMVYKDGEIKEATGEVLKHKIDIRSSNSKEECHSYKVEVEISKFSSTTKF